MGFGTVGGAAASIGGESASGPFVESVGADEGATAASDWEVATGAPFMPDGPGASRVNWG